MNKEDYFKYYIQGSDHYLIPKDVFDELFDEMESWKEDAQKYKEVIDKAINYIEKESAFLSDDEYELFNKKELKDILKESGE